MQVLHHHAPGEESGAEVGLGVLERMVSSLLAGVSWLCILGISAAADRALELVRLILHLCTCSLDFCVYVF